MPSVFKPAGRTKYRINYIDGNGQRKVVPGFADKKATQALAHQLEQNAERERAGLPVVAQARRQEPIAQLIQAYIDELVRLNRSHIHKYNTKNRLVRIFDKLHWPNLASFRLEQFSAFLQQMNRSANTKNGYRASLYQFFQFCCVQGWAETNPLKSFRPTPLVKVRHRRAYTPEEFRRLCLTHSGELYMVAGLSGFRRGELAQMEKQDLSPYADPPAWHPRKEITKARRRDTIPILPDLLPTIRRIWDSLPEPTSKLFPVTPTYPQMKRDRKQAAIPELDAQGRHADFHGLRYTYCTLLAKIMPIHQVQKMMRHADVRMTSAVYMDLDIHDLWTTTQSIPTLLPGIDLVPPVVPLPEKPIISHGKPAIAN